MSTGTPASQDKSRPQTAGDLSNSETEEKHKTDTKTPENALSKEMEDQWINAAESSTESRNEPSQQLHDSSVGDTGMVLSSGMASHSPGDVTFESKRKLRKSKMVLNDPSSHLVTFTITISQAIPTDEDEDVLDIREMVKARKRVLEAPRPKNYYHLEYYLLSDDVEPVKTDLVTFGLAAKIYVERHEPRLLKTWQDGDITWVAWSHSHTLTVTKDLLLKLVNHTLELRIWDTKDRCSTRARFDRPKTFRLPPSKPGEDINDLGGIKGTVIKQSKSFTNMQPKKSMAIRPLPSHVTFHQLPTTQPRISHSPQKTADGTDSKMSIGGSTRRRLSITTQGDLKDLIPETSDIGVKDATGAKSDVLCAMPAPVSSPQKSYSQLGSLAEADQTYSPANSRGSDVQNAMSNAALSGPPPVSKLRPSNVDVCAVRSRSELEAGSAPSRITDLMGMQQTSANGIKSQHTGREMTGSNLAGQSHLNLKPVTSQMQHQRPPKLGNISGLTQENIRKHGVCNVSVKMGLFFTGKRSITSRLDKAHPGIEDCFVTVALDGPLMSPEQHRELNPMSIKLRSTNNLPNMPIPYKQLQEKCLPVYCKYKLHNLPEYVTMGKSHAESLYWDDVNICLTGTLEWSGFYEFLSGPPLEIEVHDRDRKRYEVKPKPTLFGEELEDEKISNVNTVACRRTLYNAFHSRAKPWDPYGVAKVDLSELLVGCRYVRYTIPIHSCAIPDVLGLQPPIEQSSMMSSLVGVAGAVDGPVSQPLPCGHYLECNAVLKVEIELAFPLITPQQVALKHDMPVTYECPFGRIIFKLGYRNTWFLHRLQTMVSTINALALNMSDMPQHVVDAALSTYKLSIAQQQSKELDIVTGFHVMDGQFHLFILEGLKEHAVLRLWQNLPQPENEDVSVLYNSDLVFSERLYGPLDVDVCRIKLHEALSIIVQQPLLYVRDMVPKPCYQALVNIHQIIQSVRMRDIVRNNLFPTAEMVVSMSKEFGVPITAKDFQDLEPVEPGSERVTEEPKERTFLKLLTSRLWTPIDHYNLAYAKQVVDREMMPHQVDYLAENIENVKCRSMENHEKNASTKPMMVHACVTTAHNYSTQTLNSTELAKQVLREKLKPQDSWIESPEAHESYTAEITIHSVQTDKGVTMNGSEATIALSTETPPVVKKAPHEITQVQLDKDTLYTYCPAYHHSMTIVPINIDEEQKGLALKSRDAWKTARGWSYPGVLDARECNQHEQAPDPARQEELKQPWLENILHANILEPTLKREKWPWKRRSTDLDLYSCPPEFFGQEPITIHNAGEKLRQERLQSKEIAHQDWLSKIVVDDTRQRFHRCFTGTELCEVGQKSSNQIDRLVGLLKDTPMSFSLTCPQLILKDIPALDVVNNPSVDVSARKEGTLVHEENGKEKTCGYHPGPYRDYSWLLERNKVPAQNYDHAHFTSAKGQDFAPYYKSHASLWKRPINPLRLDERNSFLFRVHNNDGTISQCPPVNLDASRQRPLPPINSTLMPSTKV